MPVPVKDEEFASSILFPLERLKLLSTGKRIASMDASYICDVIVKRMKQCGYEVWREPSGNHSTHPDQTRRAPMPDGYITHEELMNRG